MAFKNSSSLQKVGQFIAATFFSIGLFSTGAQASEVFFQLNKGDQPGSLGYTLGMSENILESRNLRWGFAYNDLDQLETEWNGKTVYFSNKTLDGYLAYRYFPATYNRFFKQFSFEFQAGVSVSLTENKNIFILNNPPINTEITFSEKGDINTLVSFSTQYQISRQSKLELGYKYYPDFSEFGGVGVLFLGINYQFGRQFGY